MSEETGRRWASTLDSVVVYAQGAVCRRLARGVVPRDGRVRVAGLPRTLDPGSLRARVLGASGVRVTEARVEVASAPLDGEAPDALRREVERLRDAYAAAEGRRDRQRTLIAEVEGLHPVPPARKREDPHRRTAVDAWLALADFVDERLARLHARLVECEEELLRVEHELSVAADRLARASTDAPSRHVETTVSAVLTLAGAADGETPAEAELEVELEYGVPGAVWVPAYRLSHRRGDDGGRLVLRASVAQRTGEDWTGVRLALATADLRRRTDLPRLRSVRIGRRQAAPAPSGWREPPAGLSDLFDGYEAAGPGPVPASGFGGAAAGSVAVPVAAAPVPPPPPAPVPPPFAGPPTLTGAPPPPGAVYGFAPEGPGGAPGSAEQGYGGAPASPASA
ncbi:DUF4139 domain-containing protein, partial [Streptomyces sp. NPDC006324]|uniref:DUF4139 domain-containing protein n=1 Tax=Streptomyces sp. NPDC006324 TaxID=3156751 RepID=UPI0033A129F7